MVDIPNEIEEYGFRLEKAPKDVEKTVLNNLNILKTQGQKLIDTYERYCQADDTMLQEDLAESMTSRLNHIVQAFKDIVAYIEIHEKGRVSEGSIRYYKRFFVSLELDISPEAEKALDFMQKRNDLIHDYFNIEKLNRELITGIANFGNGFLEIADSIEKYCIKHIPELMLQQNIKEVLKQEPKKNR